MAPASSPVDFSGGIAVCAGISDTRVCRAVGLTGRGGKDVATGILNADVDVMVSVVAVREVVTLAIFALDAIIHETESISVVLFVAGVSGGLREIVKRAFVAVKRGSVAVRVIGDKVGDGVCWAVRM
jgi:hypothetical protein